MRFNFNLPQMEVVAKVEEVHVYFTKEYQSWYHDGMEGYYYNSKKTTFQKWLFTNGTMKYKK